MEKRKTKLHKRPLCEAEVEALSRLRNWSGDDFDKLEVALWRLEGLLDLLGVCDFNHADEVNWEHVAHAMQAFTDEIKGAFDGLHQEWQAARSLAREGAEA